MIEKMTAYFAAEKQESLLFMLCLDLFAEARGGGYLAALRALPG